ncbi:MAG: hypothetical protein JO316_24130 [Abitibacteriaceae bacterium]|nr:hypothetical protein [Abditibacteriaceae bacterium]MBV9868455.1 hypothetical protein [Abditibacteriaceae bacterium]
MPDIINKLVANDFAALKGLTINGRVPVQDQVINELIAEFLTRGQASQTSTQPPSNGGAAASYQTDSPPTSKPNITMSDAIKFLKKAEVKADAGKVILDFEIAI